MDPPAFFRWAERGYQVMGSPFLSALAPRCADDPQLMALASEADRNQPYVFAFFGAVHFLVLANPGDAFSPLFGGGGRVPVADDATFVGLKDFCRRRRGEISNLLKRRTVQFTEPVRASFLVTLLGHIMAEGAVEPYSFVEVGCSAGLLTVFDRYYYDFGALGRVGKPSNPHVRVGQFRGGSPRIPDHMPVISERYGIDLNPVDPADPEERRWIEGQMAPDMFEQRAELREALKLRAELPLVTIKGDALLTVPDLLPKLTATPVVFHSACLYQWPPAQQQEFHEILCAASRVRTIYRVAMDALDENPCRPPRPSELGPHKGPKVELFTVTYRDGKADWNLLGLADGFGGRVKWMA
jgi:hypothetical protein